MSSQSLPTHELSQVAREEAVAFVLPEDWRQGRGNMNGFAIDEPYSPDIDDAVALSRLGSSSLLHVSIADTGSFLPQQTAISQLARRRVWSRYDGKRVIVPMIPREISEDRMSLLDGAERPVLTVHIPIDANGRYDMPKITRNVIRAKRITYAEVEDLIEDTGPAATALRGLERVACLLYAARHTEDVDPEDAILEDEEGNPLASDDYDTGKLIVQESMIAANAAVAKFMIAHSIPALFRNHVVPDELMPEITNPFDRARLLRSLARAEYGTESLGHAGLNLPSYLHFTSPIRRFPDFANHANIVAFLDGKEYPYPMDRLGRIAERLQMLALKEVAAQSGVRSRGPRKERSEGSLPSPYRRASYLLSKFAAESAGPGELATALFNPIGTPEELVAVRTAAAQYAAQHIHHARPALNVALSRKLVTLRAVQPEEKLRGATFALEDAQGNVYPYLLDRAPLSIAVSSARVIGQICGVAVEPVVPESKTREGRLLEGGFNYLRKLGDEKRLDIKWQTHEQGDETIAVVKIVFGGVEHTAEVAASSKKRALRDASAELIRQHDLIKTPPEVRVEPKHNPLTILHARQNFANAPQAEFTVSEVVSDDDSEAKDESGFVCTVTVIDADGTPYQAVAKGISKKDAKHRAASAILEQMPVRPINKKGETY